MSTLIFLNAINFRNTYKGGNRFTKLTRNKDFKASKHLERYLKRELLAIELMNYKIPHFGSTR